MDQQAEGWRPPMANPPSEKSNMVCCRYCGAKIYAAAEYCPKCMKQQSAGPTQVHTVRRFTPPEEYLRATARPTKREVVAARVAAFLLVFTFIAMVVFFACAGTEPTGTPQPTTVVRAVAGGSTYSRSLVTPRPTAVPRLRSPETSRTVYITNTGTKYHKGSCQYLRQSKIEIDLDRAIKRGYTACSRCGG